MIVFLLFIFSAIAATLWQSWTSFIIGWSVWYVFNFYWNNVWRKLGIPYLFALPIFGNDLRRVLGAVTVQDLQREKYEKFGDARFGGVHTLMGPFFFIKDTQLIETVLTTDFAHFVDRGTGLRDDKEPLTRHLFNLNGKTWKGLRNKLSPAFTSGKLKTMHHQLTDCADVLLEVLDDSCRTGEEVNFRETMAKFTTDVIGSCAYGLNMNSLKDPDNEFRKMGRKVFRQDFLRFIQALVFFFLTSVSAKLASAVRPISKDVTEFFLNLVRNTIKAREENPEYKRNDFIQIIMNLRRQDKIENGTTKQIDDSIVAKDNDGTNDKEEVYLDDNTMAANSFLFFVAGFETTASTLTYCLFELAKHPEIQEKLYNEVMDVLSKHDGQPTYDAIKNLHYMEMVLSETLRKYPPVPLLFRICTEKYQVPGTDLTLPKGCRVEIPVYSLHHDPNIYPDPEKFVPERFSPEVKDSIPKGAYLPFGDGPRICIGARFAQMEMKVCLSKILSKYKIVKNSTMPDVIEFDTKSALILLPKGGIFMNIEAREN